MPTPIKIDLIVDDKGTVKVKRFGSEAVKEIKRVDMASATATARWHQRIAKLTGAFLKITGAIYAVSKAWGMMQTAAKARQERKAFNNMAASYGTSGDKIIATLKRVSGQTIDTMTLVRTAGTAMMMGIAPDKITKLMEIARVTARQTGQTVTKAFGDISLAVARQSRMILDNLGIIVSVEKANEKYAAVTGKVASQLTDADKKQAFMNATLKAGEDLMKRLGKQTDTVSDKLERFNASVENIKVGLGDFGIRLFQFLEGTANAAGSLVMKISYEIFSLLQNTGKLMDLIPGLNGAADYWRIQAEAAYNSMWDLAEKSDQAFKDAFASGEKATASQTKYKKSVQDTTQAVKEQTKAAKKFADQTKKIVNAEKEAADLRKAAVEAMYKEANIDAEAYYASEASDLIKKVSKWEKTGVDINKINEYLYDQFGKMAEEAWEKGEDAAAEYMDTMQAKSQVLVSEFQSMENESLSILDGIGIKIADLDGSNIGVTFSLYDQASPALDRIAEKINALKRSMAIPTLEPAMNAGSVSQQSNTGLESQAGQESVVTENQSIVNEGSRSVNLHISQKLSRSDIANIVAEQERQKLRG